MRKRSLWRPGLYVSALGAAYFAGTWLFIQMPGDLAAYYSSALDPFLIPRWTGALLMAAGIWLSLTCPVAESVKSPVEVEKEDGKEGAAWLRLPVAKNDVLLAAALLVVFLAYAVSMQFLGFTLPTFVLMCLEVWALGERSMRTAALFSLLYSAAIYALFARLLQLPLPTGLVGF